MSTDNYKRKSQNEVKNDELKRHKLDFNTWEVSKNFDSDNIEKEKTPQKNKLDHDIWNDSISSLKQIKIGDLIIGKWFAQT